MEIAPFCPGHNNNSSSGNNAFAAAAPPPPAPAKVPQDVADATTRYVMAAVTFLEKQCGVGVVTGLQAEFVMDENSQMWLKRIAKVFTNYEPVVRTTTTKVKYSFLVV